MGVGFQDPAQRAALLAGAQSSSACAEVVPVRPRAGVEVEHRVDDRSAWRAAGIGDQVAPGAGAGVVEGDWTTGLAFIGWLATPAAGSQREVEHVGQAGAGLAQPQFRQRLVRVAGSRRR